MQQLLTQARMTPGKQNYSIALFDNFKSFKEILEDLCCTGCILRSVYLKHHTLRVHVRARQSVVEVVM